MYDGVQTLTAIDQHKLGILALCSLAMVCNYTWFFASYVIARREKTYSIPIFCTLFWFAGDGSFVAHYHTWFTTYHHWYVELFWVALLFTVTFEVAFIVQAIQYGRTELLPSANPRQFAALIVAGAAAAIVIWNALSHAMGDPLAVTYFSVANAALPVMYVGVLMRRRSSAGTAPIVWWGYLGMITFWFIALAVFFGPEFRSFWYLALWALCTIAGTGVLIAVKRLPKTQRQPTTLSSAPVGTTAG
ncbi:MULTISPECIES: hypothetical protein [Mycobacterium]|uniref:Uncharacterized protein n=1 Tax=Mycobacterium kiyosense TaxID=2871094 RepID=A0A9P3QAK1_9MYCO|nr:MULTISPECIES: hypothetical protein [Mycobacterium]BDB42238.1 hypothetical protein IWGMT90018_26840 [Mycobacterium kiyosense]BDE14491.1 hypothetical protein MKCMC460_33510 [Mycobacterium sp. 20KCMC460]GLB83798.1 hypothetical protein SRL2020028_30540 [Mycobacterium kiyosense]GLB91175.1 hypothetical protein SRL2020130_39920 [Mycobacterium kiyosense]GLB97287.1 hypothetical protein SRL2020226_40630 [Mycobacterium kiyosense]